VFLNMSKNIYSDGNYIRLNPTLHEEDSDYKFLYIKILLKNLCFEKDTIRVLDVGGGAGVVAAKVCDYLNTHYDKSIECHALDLSADMLEFQKSNNKYCTYTTTDIKNIHSFPRYDLVLIIDVIEHVEKASEIAKKLDELSCYAIYNVPLEKNLFDWMRNIYMKGMYYKAQTQTLGHVHFFSFLSAKSFLKKHHHLLNYISPDFCGHILGSSHQDNVRQRKNKLRLFELKVSKWIYKKLHVFSPYIIQGSLFALTKSNSWKK